MFIYGIIIVLSLVLIMVFNCVLFIKVWFVLLVWFKFGKINVVVKNILILVLMGLKVCVRLSLWVVVCLYFNCMI